MAVEKNFSKLAQLFNCLNSSDTFKTASKILDKEGDVNFAFPENLNIKKYSGFTALHFALLKNDINVFNVLLEHGSDYTLKDKDGETILTKFKKRFRNQDDLFIKLVLRQHTKAITCSNPANKYGLSHFLVSCIMNNLEAVEYFLRNEVAVDSVISLDSDFFPGYTALHFAAKQNNYSLAKLLLEYGANVNITDAKKMTALHILIENRIELFDALALVTFPVSFEDLQQTIIKNGSILQMMMENFSDSHCEDIIGMSNFHVASILQDFHLVENIANGLPDINQSINADAHLWAGYTALHFAAHINVEMVHFLIGLGADIEAKNQNQVTPLDICIQKYEISDIKKIIESQNKWANIVLSDDRIKLIDFISVLAHECSLGQVMKHSISSKPYDISISKDSPLWPGFTLLHLVVLFAKEPGRKNNPQEMYNGNIFSKIIKLCLENQENLIAKNRLGQTPLHLAFRLRKRNIIRLFLQLVPKITDSVDHQNLSHLHILTSFNKPDILEISDTNNSDVNVIYNGRLPIGPIQPGFTALHVALKYRETFQLKDSVAIVKLLLKRGANCHIADVHGLTPVHWLLSFPQACAGFIAAYLLKNVQNLVASEHNLSYLHIATFSNQKRAVKYLLEKKVDVNMSIKVREIKYKDPLRFLAAYSRFTPLHMCFYFKTDIPFLLINHDANVFLKNDDEHFPPLDPCVYSAFFESLKQNVKLQQYMEAKFGVTKLHLACEYVSFRKIRNLLDSGSNINAKIDVSSPIWKGYTPLHVLLAKAKTAASFDSSSKLYDMIINVVTLLLKNGADATIQNQKQESPIGIFFRFILNDREHEIMDLLMQHIIDFTVNPENEQVVRHFHMACHENNIVVVEKFLLNGIGIQQPINFFANEFAGANPLHFTTKPEIVNVLIENGFSVDYEDAYGNTPLHKVAERSPFNDVVFDKLIKSGAHINAENIYGQTPLEILLSSPTASFKNVLHFINYGCSMNTHNSINNIRYLSIVVKTKYTDNFIRDQIIQHLWDAPEIREHSSKQTLLYDIVSVSKSTLKVDDYIILIKKLTKHGYNIDAQNREGKSALIISVIYGNNAGVEALLMCGADINIIDAFQKTAMNYLNSIEYEQRDSNFGIRKLILEHVQKIKNLKLELNQLNHECFDTMKNTYPLDILDEASFLEHVNHLRLLKVNSICLQDFFSKHGVSLQYSPAIKTKRRIWIDQFVESIEKDNRFNFIKDIVNLQYKKGVGRSKLIFFATHSIKNVLNFDFPNLCALNLFQFLTNSELQNLIDASMNNQCDTA